MKQSIYFASTILHFYAASSIAADRDEVAHIVFIDQPKGKPFPLADIAREWPSSPFQSVRLFHGRFKGIINKLHQRKKLFSQLKKLIFDIRPSHIFVGNDRRIEFQFCMHCANKIKAPAIGHYMDEGTYTYVGRKASSSFGDTIIDNFLKKMSYGLWWKNPKTVGESAWISDIHVAFPELIDERLKNKKIRQLDHNQFISPEIMQLSESILKFYGVALSRLSSLDALVTLPHESLFTQNPDYRSTLIEQINEMKEQGLTVAAKYHPRNSGPDILNLAAAGVDLLPAGVSFEAILPILPSTTHIIGDLSSTLLIARWLRPELKVTSICSGKGNPDFIKLFNALDIKVNYI